jgi:crotonobetainyl-CoA:carnitine CoA-transferase CaiB-like acyl-CoA transferase
MSGPQPLAGIKVVEFSHMVMGPSCGLILGDLGADVVKVEPVPDGDNTRRLAGSGAGFFAAMNRNKRSVVLDLKSAEGMDFARKLIREADVVLENFRPGALDGMGLGYETLKADNARLIYCSLKGFLAGPYENRTALDEVVQMMGGLAYMTGPPGRPLRAGASVNDIMGGMFGVIGILAALNERHVTGRGQHITSGLFENNMFLVSQHMLQYAVTGKPANPMPERLAAWAVYDVFDTSDSSQVFIGVVSDSQWRTFCDAFDLLDLVDAPGLGSNRERVLQRDQFLPRLRQLFAGRTKADILAECERIGLPFAPITKPHELFDDPHLNHPGAMVSVTLEDGRTTPVPALPLSMGGERLGLRRDLPKPGEHGAAVARELGIDEETIAALIARGVLGALDSKH